jgi:hypothetical protein
VHRKWIVDRLVTLDDMKHVAFARACDVNESTVRRWIAGEVTPTGRSRRAMAAALQLQMDTIDDYFASEHAQSISGSRSIDVTLCNGGWDSDQSDELWRTLEHAESITHDSASQLVHAWMVTPAPQTVEVTAGRRIGPELVSKVERRVEYLRRLDDVVGGRDLFGLLRQEFMATASLLHGAAYTDVLGRRLLSAIGDLCQLTERVAWDAGEPEHVAHGYFCAGLKAAHACGDSSLASNLISSRAYYMVDVGRVDQGLVIARSAVSGRGKARAIVRDRLAWALANAGDLRQTEAAHGAAEDDYDSRPAAEDEPAWAYWMNPGELDILAARCWVVLGQPRRAIPLLRDALLGYEQRHTREVALYTSFLAEAYVQAGEVEEAAYQASHAATLSSQTTSTRSDLRAQRLLGLLKPHENVPAVRQFGELMHSLQLRQ